MQMHSEGLIDLEVTHLGDYFMTQPPQAMGAWSPGLLCTPTRGTLSQFESM